MYNICTISGDGVGPEIINSAKSVLVALSKKYNFDINFVEAEFGGIAIDKYGTPMPQKSMDIVKQSDAVLLGAIGGPKWNNCCPRPESALLGLRKTLNLYANFRRVKLYDCLKEASPLKERIVNKGIDYIIVRELTGGMYFGDRGYRIGKYGREAYDTEVYGEIEIERIVRQAYELSEQRKHKLISIDKANVLESSRLWRKVVHDLNEDYPTVEVEDMLVDNASMQMVLNPSQFDVIVSSNMFGDILSDLGAATVGSIGMTASASLCDSTVGLYEAIHGSAPTLQGKNIVNPIATILSSAMMLRHSFDRNDIASKIEQAIDITLKDGYRTADLAACDAKHDKILSTTEITQVIIDNL